MPVAGTTHGHYLPPQILMLDIGVLLALQVVFDAGGRLCLGQRRHVRYSLVGKAVPAILQEPRKKRLGG